MVQMNYRKSHNELGNYLADLIGNKLTYEQIRIALGVSKPAVHYWFTGRNRPSQKRLLKLCGLLKAKFEDVETAFALADYSLRPEEIEQANAWQISDQQTHGLLTYSDIELQLDSIRGMISGTKLYIGLQSAQSLVRRIRQHINEKGAQTRLLRLYFDALDELTGLHNGLTAPELLRGADKHSYGVMQHICDETNDQRLHARLLASKGDEDHVLGSHRASYKKLKPIIDPLLVEPELYIRPILRSSCLSLSYPGVGSEADFQHVADLLEAAIDTYANMINPMLIVLGLEGLSRAYATRYEHTCKQEYKKQARQNFEAADALAKQSIGYPIYELRVRKTRLRLARSKVLDGFSLSDQVALAREAKEVAETLRDTRSKRDVDKILTEIER